MSERDYEELVAELRDLGRAYVVPEALDQRQAVRARLARPAPRRHRARFYLSAVVAALVLAVAAISPARAAVLDAVGGLLRVAGIELRDEPHGALPATPSPLPSQEAAGLAQARARAAFPVVVPEKLGSPDRVLLADPDKNGAPRVVTLLYRGGTVRFDQFDGMVDPVFLKTAPDGQWVEGVGDVAVWLAAPHPVRYVDRDGVTRTETARLAGPSLIWTTGSVTYRLEGLATLEEASEVARSVR
ncbi:hypothetical protein GCM10010168_48790 [Actinoplanes ianthinogenes]|uniref:DUF4367 domain-containing protein n=1 Tax=Actinoplanes ianthinogenes TaxID=122358 RepID=A0ABM7LNM3_9ACTN|nr:hypothetical protein [Actinoplanes ianthinogenes]BCJ40822.1 hypothetical protein Aiant_14790 [Actinoplanes ianthinogenes]GGR24977.1 hypothetical protein GCM10010168_48790 [Actinoplanes ianthinogenes]